MSLKTSKDLNQKLFFYLSKCSSLDLLCIPEDAGELLLEVPTPEVRFLLLHIFLFPSTHVSLELLGPTQIHILVSARGIKGTVSIISSDPPFHNGTKLLTDQWPRMSDIASLIYWNALYCDTLCLQAVIYLRMWMWQ